MTSFNYGENLKELRLKKGLSQGEMASRLNISQSTYSRMEVNPDTYSYRQMGKIAVILEVTVAELMPDMAGLDERTLRIINGTAVSNPIIDFLTTPLGRLGYIAVAATVVNIFYMFTKGFCAGLETSESTMYIAASIVALITAICFYYAWKRMKRTG